MTTVFDFADSLFPAGVDLPKLKQDVEQSAILIALNGMPQLLDTTVRFTFKADLSGADEAALNAIPAAHDGLPIAPTQPVAVTGLVKLDTLTDDDNKQVVVTYPATNGFNTRFVGVDGNDQAIALSFSDAGTQSVNLSWPYPVEIHDAGVHWSPTQEACFLKDLAPRWDFEDTFSAIAILPATPCTPNGGGTGNANKVPIGGGANLIVPAAGDGAWDVDLETAVPVPADSIDHETGAIVAAGYWDCNYYTGVVTPSATPGSAKFYLFDFENQAPLLYKIPTGDPDGSFDIDASKVEWIHPRWIIRFECTKVTAGAGKIGGWLMLFRE